MKKLGVVVLLAAFLWPAVSEAQKRNPYMIDKPRSKKDRDRTPWLDKKMRYARSGWLVEPGITYTLTRFDNPTEVTEDPNNPTQSWNRTVNPNGRFGFYLGGSRYRINKSARSYWDFGIALKMLNGRELLENELINTDDNTVVTTVTGDGKFRETFALGHINYNHVIPIGQWYFLQNSLGLNADYRLNFLNLSKQTYEGGDGTPADPASVRPGNFRFQLHYKLGFGIKVNKKLMVIPTVETPILNIVKFEKFKSTHLHFQSRYRPIIFTLRFMFLRDSNKVECPPVYGSPEDKAKQDAFDTF